MSELLAWWEPAPDGCHIRLSPNYIPHAVRDRGNCLTCGNGRHEDWPSTPSGVRQAAGRVS